MNRITARGTSRIRASRLLSCSARQAKSHDHSHSHSASLFGHSHSHSHSNELLLSKNKSDPGVRITRAGLYVNLGMVLVKGAGGAVFNSQALMADAVHALSDLLSDLLTLATVSVSLRHPTPAFPHGFGKVEALGSLGVSSMLTLAGLGIGVNALESLYHLLPMADVAIAHHVAESSDSWLHGLFSHSHSHTHGAVDSPDLAAAYLAGGSILIKEWLFQATMKVAKRTNSTVLVANAWHHRVDCLTSVVAVLAITGSHFFHLTWLDPAGGLLVSGVILHAGLSAAKQAVLELADHSMPAPDLQIARTAADKVAQAPPPGLQVQVININGIKSGPVLTVDTDIRVTSDAGPVTLEQANAVAQLVRAQVAADLPAVRDVRVRTFTKAERAESWIDTSL